MSVLRSARIVTALLVASASLAPQRADAQVAYDTPQEHVEVLGLRTWTLAMLRDSIRHRVPGQTLEDAACMVILRDSLHFADAMVSHLIFKSGPNAPGTNYLVIKVIEPADAWRVRWAPEPPDNYTVLRPAYAPVVLAVTDSLGGLWVGRLMWPLQFYPRDSVQRTGAFGGGGPAGRDDALRLWQFLDSHRSDADWHTAMTALRRDRFYANRLVAAMVLANFAARDSTLLALTEALRDPMESVRDAASMVLAGLPSRTVNWAPAAPTLRLLLGGTNLPAMDGVLGMLTRTHVSPALAAPLLRKNDEWVLRHLRASYPGASSSAHALLVELHGGKDLGASERAWTHWLASL